MDGQWCYAAHDNQLVACDTDFVQAWDTRASWGEPPSYTTAVTRRPRDCRPKCRIERFFQLNATLEQPHDTILVDLPLAVATTVLRPLTAVLPLLTPLIEEIESRHADLVGGDATARQLSFSCMAAWLRAAIRSRYEPNQRPTRR